MADLTVEQEARVEAIVAQGVSRERAVEIVVDPQLDYPVKHGSGPDESVPRLVSE
jgi:hypothetical protein